MGLVFFFSIHAQTIPLVSSRNDVYLKAKAPTQMKQTKRFNSPAGLSKSIFFEQMY